MKIDLKELDEFFFRYGTPEAREHLVDALLQNVREWLAHFDAHREEEHRTYSALVDSQFKLWSRPELTPAQKQHLADLREDIEQFRKARDAWADDWLDIFKILWAVCNPEDNAQGDTFNHDLLESIISSYRERRSISAETKRKAAAGAPPRTREEVKQRMHADLDAVRITEDWLRGPIKPIRARYGGIHHTTARRAREDVLQERSERSAIASAQEGSGANSIVEFPHRKIP